MAAAAAAQVVHRCDDAKESGQLSKFLVVQFLTPTSNIDHE